MTNHSEVVSNSNNPSREDVLQPTLPKLLTPEQFWQALGKSIGKNAIYDFIDADRIRHIKVGRKILIPYTEVEDFITREASPSN
jgi:excisionase family DNA binding protein